MLYAQLIIQDVLALKLNKILTFIIYIMKNQGLKNLVQRSNLLKVNDDFIILSEHNNAYLRGGGDGGCE